MCNLWDLDTTQIMWINNVPSSTWNVWLGHYILLLLIWVLMSVCPTSEKNMTSDPIWMLTFTWSKTFSTATILVNDEQINGVSGIFLLVRFEFFFIFSLVFRCMCVWGFFGVFFNCCCLCCFFVVVVDILWKIFSLQLSINNLLFSCYGRCNINHAYLSTLNCFYLLPKKKC